MRFKDIAKTLSDYLWNFLFYREIRRLDAKNLEAQGILPDFRTSEENIKEDFPKIREIIENFAGKKVEVYLEVDKEDMEHLEADIVTISLPSQLKDYFLKIKEMFVSSSVNIESLEEMIEANLPWSIYTITYSTFRMTCGGKYYPQSDLIRLNFSAIRREVCGEFYKGISPSRLRREEKAYQRVLLGEEIAHSVFKNFTLQLSNLENLCRLQLYEVGKEATSFLKKKPSYIKDFNRGLKEALKTYLPFFLFPSPFIRERKSWSKFTEIYDVLATSAGLSEGLAKFIVKTALVENDPQLKDLYFFRRLFENIPISVSEAIKLVEQLYKQKGNSIFEEVDSDLSEEIRNFIYKKK
jgi:hypothetical protein